MAHEVRTPLASIRGAVEILGDAVPRDDPRRQFVDVLVNETDRLDRYVGTVLEFARPPRPDRGPCEVNEIVASTSTLVAKQAQQAGVRLRIECDGRIGKEMYDAGLLRHALMNLVLNAIQAMPQGGVLTLRTTAVPGGGVAIDVADTGTGIPEEIKDRMFSPFATLRPGGTGLGLSIARRIAEQHGGSLSYESSEELGTVFHMLLPGPSRMN